jgi:hypothetical protein
VGFGESEILKVKGEIHFMMYTSRHLIENSAFIEVPIHHIVRLAHMVHAAEA